MKGKSLLAACSIVPLAVATLSLYIYANQAKLDIGRYGFFHVHDGHLIIEFDHHLVWFDELAREQKAFNLTQLPLQAEGDYAFFSDGDILVHHRSSELADSKVAKEPGFYRCNLSSLSCKRFEHLPNISGSFRIAIDNRIAIDKESDTIYLARTRDSRLYKVDTSGKIMSESDRNIFKYPNQLILKDGALWVADTNNHRLVSVSTETETFGATGKSIDIDLGGEYRWPHQMAATSDGWWINVGDNGLANGRIVHVAGSTEGEAGPNISSEIPSGRDPMALAYWGQSLWVADFSEPLLQRFDDAGKPLPAPESQTLTKLTAKAQADYRHYQYLAYAGIAGFVLSYWRA